MYISKRTITLSSLILFLLIISVPSHAQLNIRASYGLGNRDLFQNYPDRSAAITVIGEYSNWIQGLGTGFAISYANFKYGTGIEDSNPAIFIGSSGTIYIDQLLTEFMDIEKIPLGGAVSPYVGVLLGLNLGAGFADNNVVITNGQVSIFALYFNAGLAVYPVKNVGVHFEVGGPTTPFSVGISTRMGGSVKYKRPF